MFLTALLSGQGHTPNQVSTSATVTISDGPTITRIELDTEADVPGLDNETFQDLANQAKEGCPVSKALASVAEIILTAKLV